MKVAGSGCQQGTLKVRLPLVDDYGGIVMKDVPLGEQVIPIMLLLLGKELVPPWRHLQGHPA